ncbi:Lysine methyltransferase, partial [Pristimantis euphronides]
MSGGEERSGGEPRDYVYADRARELRLRIPEVLVTERPHRRLSLECEIKHRVGAGVSLPGVMAAKCAGTSVILSDLAALPQCLENCIWSCAQNNLAGVPVIGLTWGEISPDLLTLPPINIILGSDVFYEPKDFEDVLVTVHFIMERNPSAEFWTTYQVR